MAYPEAQAPVVMIGTTECVVDLLESTARIIHCVVAPLTATDLANKTGSFTLDLVVYTPLAVETETGQIVATPNPATCTFASGCKVSFDLDTQPAVSSLRTGMHDTTHCYLLLLTTTYYYYLLLLATTTTYHYYLHLLATTCYY